jgi:hypothetical protein
MIYRRSDWHFERTQSRELASMPWGEPESGWLARLWVALRGDAQGMTTADHALIIAMIAASAAAGITVWARMAGIY